MTAWEKFLFVCLFFVTGHVNAYTQAIFRRKRRKKITIWIMHSISLLLNGEEEKVILN